MRKPGVEPKGWLLSLCFPLRVDGTVNNGRRGPDQSKQVPVVPGGVGTRRSAPPVECFPGHYYCTARPVRHNGWPPSRRPLDARRWCLLGRPFQLTWSSLCPLEVGHPTVAASEGCWSRSRRGACVPDHWVPRLPVTAVMLSEGCTWELRAPPWRQV